MPDLASLRANAARLTVEYAGERIALVYRPAALKGDLLQQLQSGDWTAVMAAMADAIVEWDLTDDGTPVPIDMDGMARVGFVVGGAIVRAMLGDMANPTLVASNPRTATPTPSGNGSSPAASSAPAASQTTTPSSAPPNGHTSPPGISLDSPTPPAALAGSPGSIG